MTAEDLLKQSKEILSYSPHTGKFTYIQKRKRMDIGDTAGSLNKAGYIQLNLFGKVYAAHRIAFLFMTGQWPIGVIDHKDLDKTNNKWTNLRDVTSLGIKQKERTTHPERLVSLGINAKVSGMHIFMQMGNVKLLVTLIIRRMQSLLA